MAAARETGGLAIQNRGTVGGNIANASPAADTPPALLAYGAEVELVSRAGTRWVAYEEFHTGYKQTLMRADELLARVRVRRPREGAVQRYRKVGTRRAQAISKVCFAGLAEVVDGSIADIRLALGSVAPTVLRCRKTEDVLKGASRTSQRGKPRSPRSPPKSCPSTTCARRRATAPASRRTCSQTFSHNSGGIADDLTG